MDSRPGSMSKCPELWGVDLVVRAQRVPKGSSHRRCRPIRSAAGRSAARCRGSKAARRSPAAPNTPTPCGCPACCTARSSAAPWRTAGSSRSTPARRGRFPACRRLTADDIRKVIPDPYYGPAFHDQPILAIDKVRFVGEPVAVVVAADPACRRSGRAGDRRRIRGTAGGLRRGRGDDLDDLCPRSNCGRPAASPISSTSRT